MSIPIRDECASIRIQTVFGTFTNDLAFTSIRMSVLLRTSLVSRRKFRQSSEMDLDRDQMITTN